MEWKNHIISPENQIHSNTLKRLKKISKTQHLHFYQNIYTLPELV